MMIPYKLYCSYYLKVVSAALTCSPSVAFTAPVWNAANVKQFSTSLMALVSSSFFQR